MLEICSARTPEGYCNRLAPAALATVGLVMLSMSTLGCGPKAAPSSNAGSESTRQAARDELVQFSLVSALASGHYAGTVPLRQVLASGDFGIGTFDQLDGELILLDGTIYQALANGTVRLADLDGSTPFVSVTYFEEDGRIDGLRAASLADLDEQLDRKLPRRNTPYALRIDGAFRNVTLRSVPAQSPPFRPLVEVVKEQTITEHREVRGVLIGTRCPDWIGTLNVAGYHWHFLSDDQRIGGHVFNCEFDSASLRYDECKSVLIHVPESDEFQRFDADQIQHQDIDVIERRRTE